jgi:membrane protein
VDPLAPLHALDRLQRRRPKLAFPLAVLKKLSDDHGAHLAALIAYYGFFSLLPLLLVLVTVLGYVLSGDPHLYDRIVVKGALHQFPVIGHDLQVNALRGHATALIIGIAAAIWAGLGVTLAGQRAMDQVWDIPQRERRDWLMSRLRGLVILAVLGTLNVAITTAVGLIASGLGDGLLKLLGWALSIPLNVLLFWATFRLLTSREIPTRCLVSGILIAAVGWTLLQVLGGIYVAHVVSRATSTYGVFAIMIGLLTWLYLGAQVVLIAAEANVVRVRRLWPRSLFEPATAADVQALRAVARVEERREGERVEVTFGGRSDDER